MFGGSDDFTLLRHSRQHPRGEYLTLHGDQFRRRASVEAGNPSKDLTSTPPPPPPPPQVDASGISCRLGLAMPGPPPNLSANARHPLVDFCTLRRTPANAATSNNHRPRAVQFADQQQNLAAVRFKECHVGNV